MKENTAFFGLGYILGFTAGTLWGICLMIRLALSRGPLG